MNDPCPVCGRKFDRAPGYLLGSIYFNYGVTALLVVVIYFSLFFTNTLTGRQLLWLLTAFTLLFPLWFFRYGRALWIAFDERWDPWPNEEERRAMIRCRQSQTVACELPGDNSLSAACCSRALRIVK